VADNTSRAVIVPGMPIGSGGGGTPPRNSSTSDSDDIVNCIRTHDPLSIQCETVSDVIICYVIYVQMYLLFLGISRYKCMRYSLL